ncbi:hypothetical protein [Novosphingobium sp. JCM 18896]|uniref:hypothetical protein n=1 Tax=Novosphingobium sp. JCM 18896 TaxID=2989731 RepID=UPI0022224847|nr:hypothetical protein [Novosphingobium sp. JCM 18896]MCW1432218.1 hypothetical protein [Novosphingobium sp. JCM 18896]
MTRPVISRSIAATDCGDEMSKRRFARRHGLSATQVDDLCRRVGSGQAALEAALELMKLYTAPAKACA